MEDWHLFLLENAQHCLPWLSALAPQHAGNKIGVCDIRYVRVHIISIYTYAFLNMTWGFDAEPETNINKPNPVLGMTISPCSLDGCYGHKKAILGSKKLSLLRSPGSTCSIQNPFSEDSHQWQVSGKLVGSFHDVSYLLSDKHGTSNSFC